MERNLRQIMLGVLTVTLIVGSGFSLAAQLQNESGGKQVKTQKQPLQEEEGQPSSDVIGYWQALSARSQEPLAVSWNKRSGTPRSILGKLPPVLSDSSEAAARAFLQANAPLFKLADNVSELKLVRTQESLLGRHFTFQQQYKGVPVSGAQMAVHFDQHGDIIAITNSYEPSVSVESVEPKVSRTKAIARALASVRGANNSDSSAELTIFALDRSFALAWRVVTTTDGPTWETLIDAATASLLSVPHDINRYVNGTGQVFNVNAVVATHDNSLRDNDDAASAVPLSAYSIVTLQGLVGNGNLDGEFASSANSKKRAFSFANSFLFDRSNDGFSETMGYYYLDYAQRYLQSLGFTNVNNRQQVFSVNRLKIDNSFYSPKSGEISYGLGGVDDAEDAEVILHEYGHSIQDNQVTGFGSSHEAGSMGEGFGDYWAASVGAQFSGGFQDLCLAEWDATSYSSTNPPCLRRLDSTKHYPEDLDGEVHDDGEIWSAALWQIRDTIGSADADRVIISAHFLLAPTASFNQGADALVTAAKTLGYGNHQLNQIRTILSARGFTVTV